MTGTKANRLALYLLSGIVILAAALRLYGLSAEPLWFDELSSISLAVKDPSFIMSPFSAYKFTFIMSLKAWIRVFGAGMPAIRFLPAVFGILAVPAIYLIGKEIFGRRAGLAAAFLLALSVFHIYHSQQVKQYTLLLFLVLLAVFTMLKFLSSARRSFLVFNVLLNIAILYTHPFGFPAVLFQQLYVLTGWRRVDKAVIKEWFIGQIPLLAAAAVWAGLIFAGRKHLGTLIWWISFPGLHDLADTFRTFTYGLNYGLSDEAVQMGAYPDWIVRTILIATGFFFLRGCFILASAKLRRYAALLFLWLFLPVGIALGFSYLFSPVYEIRHLFIALPAFLFIVAVGISLKMKKSFVVLILLLFSALYTFPLRLMYTANAHVDWQEAVRLMKSRGLGPDSAIVMATTKESICLIYYLSGENASSLRDFDIYGKLTRQGWQDTFVYDKYRIVTLGNELTQGKDASMDPGFGRNKTYLSRFILKDFLDKIPKDGIIKDNDQIWLCTSKWAGREYFEESIPKIMKKYFTLTFEGQAAGIKVYSFRKQDAE